MSAKFSFFYDKTLKFIASNNLPSFFLFFGIKCLPYFPIQNELVDSKLNKIILDFPVLTMWGIADFEFQLKTDDADEKRFIKYAAGLYEKYGLATFMIVIDFGLKKDKTRSVKLNFRDGLTIYYKSLIERNPDKILNNIRYKIENKIRFCGIDIVGLEALPLLDLDRNIELLKKATEIFFQLDEDCLSFNKICEIRDVLLNYSAYWEDDEVFDKLWEVTEMNGEFLTEAREYYGKIQRKEGIEEGREEGREELGYEVAADLIDDGFSAEYISKISRLDLAIVNQLILAKL